LDRDTAIGPEAKDRATRREQIAVERSIGLAQQDLGRGVERAASIGIEL
jgi:hypothetical protein